MTIPPSPQDRTPQDAPVRTAAGEARPAGGSTDGAVPVQQRPGVPAPSGPSGPSDAGGAAGTVGTARPVVRGRSPAMRELLDEYRIVVHPLAGEPNPGDVPAQPGRPVGRHAAARADGTTADRSARKAATSEGAPPGAGDSARRPAGPLHPTPPTAATVLPGAIATPRPLAPALHTPDAGSRAAAPAEGPAYADQHAGGSTRTRRDRRWWIAALAVAATAGIGVAGAVIGSADATPEIRTPDVLVVDTARVPDTARPGTPSGTPTARPGGAAPGAATAPTPSTATPPPSADRATAVVPPVTPPRPVDTGTAVVSALAPGDPGFGWPTTDPATP